MRLNLFIAFIISVLLCCKISDIMEILTSQRFYWIYIIPVIFLLLSILYKKMKFLKETLIQVFLAFFTAIPYICMLFYIFLCVLNFPPEGEFKGKLIAEAMTEREINAGNELVSLFHEFEKKIETTSYDSLISSDIEKFNKSDMLELLNKTVDERKAIFDYIAENSIVMPHTFDMTKKYCMKNYYNECDVYMSCLSAVFKLELFEVEILRAEGKYEEAVNKYVILWNRLADSYKVKDTCVADVLSLVSIQNHLGVYLYNNQEIFIEYDLTSIVALKDEIIYNLDRVYNAAFVREYEVFKAQIENSKNIWPLMDKNEFLRKLDECYYAIVQYEKNPLEEIGFEEPMDYDSIELYQLLDEPIGNAAYSLHANSFIGLSANILNKKSELGIYFFAMEKSYENVPINYRTGEKCNAKDFVDYIEISVSTPESVETYVIHK